MARRDKLCFVKAFVAHLIQVRVAARIREVVRSAVLRHARRLAGNRLRLHRVRHKRVEQCLAALKRSASAEAGTRARELLRARLRDGRREDSLRSS